MAVDPVGDHVFVSGGPGTSSIAVLGFSGNIVKTITDEPGASQMVVDPSTHTLYVALNDANAIAKIDTQTLTETARLTAYVGPTGVALAGGRLWFACGGGQGCLASMNLDGSDLTDANLGLRFPVLLASQGVAGDLLATEDPNESATTLSVYDDLSGGAPTLVKSAITRYGFTAQIEFDPAGPNLLLAAGAVNSVAISTFAQNASYRTAEGGGGAEAISDDGNYIAGVGETQVPAEPDVALFNRGDETPAETWAVGSSMPAHSLAFSPDGTKLFAVANNAQTQQLEFDVLNALPTTTISTHPDASTTSTTAEFTFDSDEAGATFACSLDGGKYAPCTSPANYWGLTVGDHTFTVNASSNGVTGPAASFNWTVGAIPPEAPTGVAAVAGDGRATVVWTAPASDGGATITAYTATSSPDGSTCTTNGSLSCTISGLRDGTAYTFTVTATNSVGSGAASTPSDAVTPRDTHPPTVPSNLAGRIVGNSLVLQWQASTDNVGVEYYRLYLNGAPMGRIAGHATTATVRVVDPKGSAVYALSAADAAGNLSPPGAATVTVRPRLRPAGVPHHVPRWAWQILAWQDHDRLGHRPRAPRKLPAWYWAWKAWRHQRFEIAS
jgi:fibronectin type III domain protein